MGKINHPHQDDRDDDGIPDSSQGQGPAQVSAGQDLDGDGSPDGGESIENNPIIINR